MSQKFFFIPDLEDTNAVVDEKNNEAIEEELEKKNPTMEGGSENGPNDNESSNGNKYNADNSKIKDNKKDGRKFIYGFFPSKEKDTNKQVVQINIEADNIKEKIKQFLIDNINFIGDDSGEDSELGKDIEAIKLSIDSSSIGSSSNNENNSEIENSNKEEDISFLENGLNKINELYPAIKIGNSDEIKQEFTEFASEEEIKKIDKIQLPKPPPGSKELVMKKFQSLMFNAGYDDNKNGSLINSDDGTKRYNKTSFEKTIKF